MRHLRAPGVIVYVSVAVSSPGKPWSPSGDTWRSVTAAPPLGVSVVDTTLQTTLSNPTVPATRVDGGTWASAPCGLLVSIAVLKPYPAICGRASRRDAVSADAAKAMHNKHSALSEASPYDIVTLCRSFTYHHGTNQSG